MIKSPRQTRIKTSQKQWFLYKVHIKRYIQTCMRSLGNINSSWLSPELSQEIPPKQTTSISENGYANVQCGTKHRSINQCR